MIIRRTHLDRAQMPNPRARRLRTWRMGRPGRTVDVIEWSDGTWTSSVTGDHR